MRQGVTRSSDHDCESTEHSPPHPDVIARLLIERYPVPRDKRIEVDVDPDQPAITVVLKDAQQRTSIRVACVRGAADSNPWMHAADAMDALFGTLIESGGNHRALPRGAEVEYEGAFFQVEVTHEIPQLERLADQILGLRYRG